MSRLGSTGFTLVELVVVMFILSVLGVTGISQFTQGVDQFKKRGFRDELLSSVRYAHKVARSSGCWIRIEFTSTAVKFLHKSSDCTPVSPSSLTDLLALPQHSSGMALAAPPGVSLGTADFYFNGAGAPVATASNTPLSAKQTISLGGKSLVIEPVTGYVHLQ